MPRCEGRGGIPFVDCPENRNDETVRFTQGDLFLCPKCDQYRFGATTGNMTSNAGRKVKSGETTNNRPERPAARQAAAANTVQEVLIPHGSVVSANMPEEEWPT